MQNDNLDNIFLSIALPDQPNQDPGPSFSTEDPKSV